LIEAGDDEGDTFFETVPAFNYASSEFDQMRWDYYVNHYDNLTRQEQDSKFVWSTPTGDTFVGLHPPAGSKPKGIWYPRAGTLVSACFKILLISL
jgi:choline dehydrogenase